ncbi:hypothetical protein [Roseisalinus antarcticus]|nr:hypothetical protein [Roseisalinus antarcticus]
MATPDLTGPHWNDALRRELAAARTNGRVGSRIVSETDRVRIWLLDLAPGDRLPFHTHVNDYFWTATSDGRARSRYADGRVVEVDYTAGDTRHHSYGAGESMTHDLENTGDTILSFVTVEFLGGPNPSLL